MANALWWVRFEDLNAPQAGRQILSLSSPDLSDTKKAIARASKTAVDRLRKKGKNPRVISVQCVG